MSDIKLHLGCFHKKIYGFINVDIRPDVEPDVVDDCFKLETFKKESVSLIYSSHMLEHATRKQASDALKRWYEVLKVGGVLRISVPDLQRVFEHYMFYKDLRYLQNFLYGSQKHDYDLHYTGWDEKTLTEDLLEVGFKKTYRYDWRKTEHFYVDDYSQAFYPHLDKIKGTLMSLNIEAVK